MELNTPGAVLHDFIADKGFVKAGRGTMGRRELEVVVRGALPASCW
jgi:hypothetical protein